MHQRRESLGAIGLAESNQSAREVGHQLETCTYPLNKADEPTRPCSRAPRYVFMESRLNRGGQWQYTDHPRCYHHSQPAQRAAALTAGYSVIELGE